jgi:hypothetical protein
MIPKFSTNKGGPFKNSMLKIIYCLLAPPYLWDINKTQTKVEHIFSNCAEVLHMTYNNLTPFLKTN